MTQRSFGLCSCYVSATSNRDDQIDHELSVDSAEQCAQLAGRDQGH